MTYSLWYWSRTEMRWRRLCHRQSWPSLLHSLRYWRGQMPNVRMHVTDTGRPPTQDDMRVLMQIATHVRQQASNVLACWCHGVMRAHPWQPGRGCPPERTFLADHQRVHP